MESFFILFLIAALAGLMDKPDCERGPLLDHARATCKAQNHVL